MYNWLCYSYQYCIKARTITFSVSALHEPSQVMYSNTPRSVEIGGLFATRCEARHGDGAATNLQVEVCELDLVMSCVRPTLKDHLEGNGCSLILGRDVLFSYISAVYLLC